MGGSLALAIGFPFFGSANMATLYAGTALLALGNGLVTFNALGPGERHGAKSPGMVQVRAGSMAAVSSIIGLLVGGLLYSVLGPHVFVIFRDAHAAGLRVGIRHPPGNAGLTVDARSTNRLERGIHARSDK